MRAAALILLSTFCLPALQALASERSAPGREAIGTILTEAKGWAILIETTESLTPGDRANTKSVEFFRRGSDVVGRTTSMAPGYNCEFTVRLREDGFDFSAKARGCAGYTDDMPFTSVQYDAADSAYPFKRLNVPQKWWFSPKR